MRPGATIAFFAIAAAVVSGADDAKAPLADAKQQLQQLQRDESAAKSGATDSSLKNVLPDLKATAQGREALPLQVLDPNQNSKDKNQQKKQDARKNWLVDGYDKLDPKSAAAKPGDKYGVASTTTDAKDDEEQSDNKQDDLLTLYEKEGKAKDKDSTGERGKKAPEQYTRAATADPLAPFLQGWLANSPVRDAALSSVNRTEPGRDALSSPVPVAPMPDAPSAPTANATPFLASGSPAKAENPYLLSLTAPMLSESQPAAQPMFPLGTSDFGVGPPAAKPPPNATPDSLLPPPRSELRKPPATPADEDKKYFPQLKRF